MPILTRNDREHLPGPVSADLRSSAVPAPMFGVIALAAALGVELMLIGFLLWGPLKRSRAVLRILTSYAGSMVRPERDLQVYAGGIFGTLLLMGLFMLAWRWIFAPRLWSTSSDDLHFNRISAGIQAALATLGLGTFLLLVLKLPISRSSVRIVPNKSVLVLLLTPGLLAIAAAAIDYRLRLIRFLRILIPGTAPSTMALSLVIQITFSLYIFDGTASSREKPGPIPLFPVMAGTTIALLLSVAIHRAPRWFLQRRSNEGRDAEKGQEYFRYCNTVQFLLAVSSFFVFALVLLGRFMSSRTDLEGVLKFQLFVPATCAVVCTLLNFRYGFSASQTQRDALHRRPRRFATFLLDVAVALAIIFTVFVPHSRWPSLAGQFFVTDELHHWNYFALGPALQVVHGTALYTAAYSQYGMGWPYAFAMLRHIIPLTYANIIGMGITYGCVYYIALYFFLRRVLNAAGWAISAIFLVLILQLFSGVDLHDLKWNFPSSTILRCPLDVGFFLVLLGYLRCGRPRWIWLAGAVSGLAVLFELDTGLYLLAVFAFFWLLKQLPMVSMKSLRLRCFWLPIIGFGLMATSVIVVGLLLGSRGTLVNRAFWSGYIEGLQNQAFSGLGLIPVSAVQTLGLSRFNESVCGMGLFGVMTFVYLFAVGSAAVRRANRNGSDSDLILGSMAVYGLGLLLIFVGRSHPYNLFHPMIPFIIVSVMLLQNAGSAAAAEAAWTSIPWGVAICSLILLWTKPEFLTYPSLFKSTFDHTALPSVAMQEHPSDLEVPLEFKHQAVVIRRVAATLKQLGRHGGEIVVLDDLDTLFYYLSDLAPWSRYSSLLPATLTLEQLRQTERALQSRQPEYVVMRARPPKIWLFPDIWRPFHDALPKAYRLDRTIGGYEFWRRTH